MTDDTTFKRTDDAARESRDRRSTLSALWVFVLFNYIYADIGLMLFSPAYQRQAASIGPGLMLVFAILLEIPIAMTLLSRVLNYGANRWTNIIAGAEGTIWVAITLVGGAPSFYLFTATIEMATTLYIVWFAWRWKKTEVAGSAASRASTDSLTFRSIGERAQ